MELLISWQSYKHLPSLADFVVFAAVAPRSVCFMK
jgi:hypothetical protein